MLNLFEVFDTSFVAPTTNTLNNAPLQEGEVIDFVKLSRLYLEGLVVRSSNLFRQGRCTVG